MVRIAVIGTGGWGKNHVRVLSELGSLVAVCDLDASRAKAFAEKYRVKGYSSVDELLETGEARRGDDLHPRLDPLRGRHQDAEGRRSTPSSRSR